MIQLTRDRGAIPPSFRDPGRHANLRELFAAERDGLRDDKVVKKKLFSSGRWKAAKPRLQVETAGKCAFCETPTAAAYFGDVEHFRPKAEYWWLAYCWDNYLFSCRVCNGNKSDIHLFRGPRATAPAVPPGTSDEALLAIARAASPVPTDMAAVQAMHDELATERADLPNPYLEDPEILFGWAADRVLREVRIVVNPDAPDQPRAARALAAANTVLKLNRDELRSDRWTLYEKLEILRDAALQGGPAGDRVRDAIELMTKPGLPYAAMVRWFARREWKLLP